MAYSCCGTDGYQDQNYLGLVSYGGNDFSPGRYNNNFGTRRYQTPYSQLEKKAYEAPKLTPLSAGAEYKTKPVGDVSYNNAHFDGPSTYGTLGKFLRGEASVAPLWYHPSVLAIMNGQANYGGANAVIGGASPAAAAKSFSAATPCKGRC